MVSGVRRWSGTKVTSVVVHSSFLASSVKPVTCGVPQGSLLGPLLFITYINDFKFSSTLLSFILYADDSSIFYSHQNPQILVETVNSELENIARWIFCE